MYDDLIARLEAATEGSLDLDVEIELAITPNRAAHPKGLRGFVISTYGRWEDSVMPVDHYTTSLDAALPGEEITMVQRINRGAGHWWTAWAVLHEHRSVTGDGHTEALARRAAGLQAIAARAADNHN